MNLLDKCSCGGIQADDTIALSISSFDLSYLVYPTEM